MIISENETIIESMKAFFFFFLQIVKLSTVKTENISKGMNFFFYFLFTYLTMRYDLKVMGSFLYILCIQLTL